MLRWTCWSGDDKSGPSQREPPSGVCKGRVADSEVKDTQRSILVLQLKRIYLLLMLCNMFLCKFQTFHLYLGSCLPFLFKSSNSCMHWTFLKYWASCSVWAPDERYLLNRNFFLCGSVNWWLNLYEKYGTKEGITVKEMRSINLVNDF